MVMDETDICITKNELFEYSSRLFSDENARPNDSTNPVPEDLENNNNTFDDIQNDILDRKINTKEIRKVVINFRNGKAAGLAERIWTRKR